MRKVAYTNHIGRTSRDTHTGKNTAICNLADLAAAEKHNNHDYTQEEVDRMQSDINLDLKGYNSQYVMVDGELVQVDGHIDLEANVRKIYEDQFAAAIEEYNLQQIAAGHPGRQIQSYIDKVSDAKQQEVAVEGLIQFGSLEDWEGMSMEDKQKVVPLLLQALKDTMGELKQEDAEFILAGASIHLNEGSPHLHYVGVPVQHAENAQKGLKTRVKKTAVFTQDTLGTGLQDNVRAKIEPQLMATFGWEFEEKRAGRNKDLTKNQIANAKLQEEIRQRQEERFLINAEISQTLDGLDERIKKFGSESIGEALSDSSTYGNALFLIAKCDNDRFAQLDQEGYELREQMLHEAMQRGLDPIKSDLNQRIQEIDSNREVTWQERQMLWEEYRNWRDNYWFHWREMRQYKLDILRKKYDADQAYFDLLYDIRKTESALVLFFKLVKLICLDVKRNEIEQDLQQLAMETEMARINSQLFAKYERQYREDLKAGRRPSDKCIKILEGLVNSMDSEYERFIGQDGKVHYADRSSEIGRERT